MPKCPGQDFRNLKAHTLRCPSCGNSVEMFSDELRRRCPRCKAEVVRAAMPSCVAWCRAAKECVGEEAYARFRQDQATRLRERLFGALEHYFGDDARRIAHAQAVTAYAETLLQHEGGDWDVVIPAAILHDVGIKAAETKYGSSAGHYQEQEGPAIAREILLREGARKEVVEEVCAIIGKHHTPGGVPGKNFALLCDADWLVNLKDEVAPEARAAAIEKVFVTETAKGLARQMWIETRRS